jgi:hypothetical protein
MDERKRIAMTAHMDGLRSIAGRIGGKQKLSGMELVALCNFAQLGLLAVFSELDGENGEKATADLERLVDGIRRHLGTPGNLDGLERLAACCAAILGGDRLGKYVWRAARTA